MVQRHSLILWSNANNEDFEISLRKANELLLTLKKFGLELSPNYITAKRKKDAKIFDWSTETLAELLKRGINKEGKIIFSDLGYRVSFFSSLKEDDSAAINLLVGVSNPNFTNKFIVNLPLSLPIYDDNQVNERLITVFKECIKILNPFWACIGNSTNLRRYDGYWNEKLPTSIQWVNYFDNEISQMFGENIIKTSPIISKEKFHLGYFLVLKNQPINDDNEKDIILQQKANKHFKL